jgi:cation diffusion facilitator CzcD-associated flavoprotein CzcO
LLVVCATGFDVSHCPRYPIIGKNGVNLADKWRDEPESYMSVATSDMPNYFLMMGPNAVVGHGSLMEALNWTGDYFCKWIKKIAAEDIKSVVPTHKAVDAFVRYGDEVHKTLVWTSKSTR